jgi:hypothetical protein
MPSQHYSRLQRFSSSPLMTRTSDPVDPTTYVWLAMGLQRSPHSEARIINDWSTRRINVFFFVLVLSGWFCVPKCPHRRVDLHHANCVILFSNISTSHTTNPVYSTGIEAAELRTSLICQQLLGSVPLWMQRFFMNVATSKQSLLQLTG